MLANRGVAFLCRPEERARLGEGTINSYFVSTMMELVGRLSDERRPLVLLHVAAVGDEDVETASLLRDLPCEPIVAIVADEAGLPRAARLARRLGLGAIFSEESWNFPRELHRWADWFDAGGPPPGIAPHLEPDTPTVSGLVVDREDKSAAVEEIVRFFRDFRDEESLLFDLRLVLEEAFNNAILHGFADEQGREKYAMDTFRRLEPGEEVRYIYGGDRRTLAVSISDNRGRLKRDTVLARIERQLNAEGVFDQNGRGLHLIYALAPRAIFRVAPRRATEIVALFPARPTSWIEPTPLRPLLVFTGS